MSFSLDFGGVCVKLDPDWAGTKIVFQHVNEKELLLDLSSFTGTLRVTKQQVVAAAGEKTPSAVTTTTTAAVDGSVTTKPTETVKETVSDDETDGSNGNSGVDSSSKVGPSRGQQQLNFRKVCVRVRCPLDCRHLYSFIQSFIGTFVATYVRSIIAMPLLPERTSFLYLSHLSTLAQTTIYCALSCSLFFSFFTPLSNDRCR